MESLSKSAVRIKLETAGRRGGGAERGKERKKKLRKQRRQQQLCQFYNGGKNNNCYVAVFCEACANTEFIDQTAVRRLLY